MEKIVKYDRWKKRDRESGKRLSGTVISTSNELESVQRVVEFHISQ